MVQINSLFIIQNGGKGREVSDAQTTKVARGNDSSDTESEGEEERDEESAKILESGGRDKVAYFFWQGELCRSGILKYTSTYFTHTDIVYA